MKLSRPVMLLILFAGAFLLYLVAYFAARYKRADGLFLKKERKVALFYSILTSIFVLILELGSSDNTGMGMLFIPLALMPLTLIHCGDILCAVFARRAGPLMAGIRVALNVVGFNILMFFVDILLVMLPLNLFYMLGWGHGK